MGDQAGDGRCGADVRVGYLAATGDDEDALILAAWADQRWIVPNDNAYWVNYGTSEMRGRPGAVVLD